MSIVVYVSFPFSRSKSSQYSFHRRVCDEKTFQPFKKSERVSERETHTATLRHLTFDVWTNESAFCIVISISQIAISLGKTTIKNATTTAIFTQLQIRSGICFIGKCGFGEKVQKEWDEKTINDNRAHISIYICVVHNAIVSTWTRLWWLRLVAVQMCNNKWKRKQTVYMDTVVAYLLVFAASLPVCVCKLCMQRWTLQRIRFIGISCLRLPESIFHCHSSIFITLATSLCLRLHGLPSFPLSFLVQKFYFHNLKLLAIRSAFSSGWNWNANIHVCHYFEVIQKLIKIFARYFVAIFPVFSHTLAPKIVVCCQSSRHRDAHTHTISRQWFMQFQNSNFPYHANFRAFTHLFCCCFRCFFSIRSPAHPTLILTY